MKGDCYPYRLLVNHPVSLTLDLLTVSLFCCSGRCSVVIGQSLVANTMIPQQTPFLPHQQVIQVTCPYDELCNAPITCFAMPCMLSVKLVPLMKILTTLPVLHRVRMILILMPAICRLVPFQRLGFTRAR